MYVLFIHFSYVQYYVRICMLCTYRNHSNVLWMICVYVNTIYIHISYHIFALFNSLYTILLMLNLCGMYIFGIYLNYSSMLWMICMSVSPIRIHISYVIYVQYLCLIFSIYNILFIVRISYYSSKIIMICMFVSPICVCIHKPYHICSMQVWFSIR